MIKTGGSLLDLEDLGLRIRAVCRQRADRRCVLFPGGGGTANLVRDWHRRFRLSENAAHQLAIEALQLNAALLQQLLPGSRIIESGADFEGTGPDGIGYGGIGYGGAGYERSGEHAQILILAPRDELERLEQKYPDEAPAHHWDVTSDSLAAWIAHCWMADELILLKSADCPHTLTVTDAVRAGLVDPCFPGIAGHLPRVSWCAARQDPVTIHPWLIDGRRVSH